MAPRGTHFRGRRAHGGVASCIPWFRAGEALPIWRAIIDAQPNRAFTGCALSLDPDASTDAGSLTACELINQAFEDLPGRQSRL